MGFARSFRRQMNRRKEATAKKRRKVMLEPLEPRILLDAEMTFSMAGAAHDLTLRLDDVDGIETLHLIDNQDQSPDIQVIMSQSLLGTTGVTITGSDRDDALTID
ncbi:MAG: LEPR-XLL domain-containing protein, partial [Deltaproteobacteria bacterium]|nr:LEPR-XLL domain-containing protein [Deltaproteobacteria bacterium]